MNRRIPTIAAAAIVAVLTLSACTPNGTTPTKTPSSSPTSATPTPDAGAAPTQKPVAPPKDADQAVADANHAYIEYRKVWFNFLADPDLTTDYLAGYVLPDSRKARLAKDTYDTKVAKSTTVKGTPFVWTLNAGMSYTAETTNQSTGEKNPLGSVELFGCSDNTTVTFLENGVENTEVPKGSYPNEVTMIYKPDHKAWFVADEISLRGKEGAPLC